MSTSPMRRQVLLLASAQAFAQTASVVIGTIGGLAGGLIAEDPRLATAPITAMILGTALTMVPASMWMARVGRRAGFILGAVLGAAGGIVAALGVAKNSLLLLCLGTLLVGSYQGFAQYYRFAAAEVADDAFRPRAISFVLAGGVVAAIAGPVLASLGSDSLTPQYLGSFLLLSTVASIATVLLFQVNVPRPAVTAGGAAPRPLMEIVRQPAYLTALIGAGTAYGVMILAMTATPLAMVHHHHPVSDAALVIQFHVLGMFLPSFFTGALIARYGVMRVMQTGIALLAGHVLVSLTGTALPSFISALTLLGVGWNFLFIGGTTLLTGAYTAAERGRAQAMNDIVIFGVGLSSSLGAGALLQELGWHTMNLVLLPWLGLAALAMAWLMRRSAPAAPSGGAHASRGENSRPISPNGNALSARP